MKSVMLPSILLDQTATVYARDANGAYTVVAASNVAVRLANLSTKSAASGFDRAELAALRRLVWGPEMTFDEHAQIEVNGERWNVVAGTLQQARGPSGELVYQAVDVRRPHG